MLPSIGKIPSYIFFLIVGFIAIIIFYIITRKRYSFKWYVALILGLIMALAELISAKIMFIIEVPYSLEHWQIWNNGFSLFGVFFFTPLILLLVSCILKVKHLDLFDYLFPVGLLQLSIYRIGCMCTGCCYGIQVGWGITNGVTDGLFPVQPFEAVLDLLAFILIFFLTSKNKLKRGEAFYITYISYGLIRFAMEFFRERTNVIGIFSTSHFFALAILIFGIAKLLYSRLSKKNDLEYE